MPLLESYTINIFLQRFPGHVWGRSECCFPFATYFLKLFQFQNDKNYLYWPYTIILAYMIILISQTGNPTQLFHSARLFETAE